MAARYSEEEKQKVVDFVVEYDRENGRGGQAAAKKEFGINPISIKKWLVEAGHETPSKRKRKASRKTGRRKNGSTAVAARSAASPVKGGSTTMVLQRMAKIQEEIDGLQVEFEQLKQQL